MWWRVAHAAQAGSTNIQFSLFKIMGTPLKLRAGFTGRPQAALSATSFGSFKRIDFGLGSYGCCVADMRGQIAVAVFPLYGRFRAGSAVPTGLQFGTAVAALALLYDLMANPAVV